MKRALGLLATLLLLGVGIAAWLRAGEAARTPARAEATAAPAPAAAADTPPPAGAAPLAASAPERQRRLALVRAEPDLSERARQQELAAEADARWQDAVDAGGYTADDLDPAVRTLFRELDLEPRYAPEGRVDGLVIRGLPAHHALARAGFREGDRIVRIQGVSIEDPSELPPLLARLGPNLELCAERDGATECRELHLE